MLPAGGLEPGRVVPAGKGARDDARGRRGGRRRPASHRPVDAASPVRQAEERPRVGRRGRRFEPRVPRALWQQRKGAVCNGQPELEGQVPPELRWQGAQRKHRVEATAQ